MANYSELIATINDQIKANGNQEITGSVLNSVLQAMVSALGEGFQFMGVATPDTNPGTPDGKVFYIAVEPGTYVNFNATVLATAQLAVFAFSNVLSVQIIDLPQSIYTDSNFTKALDKSKPGIFIEGKTGLCVPYFFKGGTVSEWNKSKNWRPVRPNKQVRIISGVAQFTPKQNASGEYQVGPDWEFIVLKTIQVEYVPYMYYDWEHINAANIAINTVRRTIRVDIPVGSYDISMPAYTLWLDVVNKSILDYPKDFYTCLPLINLYNSGEKYSGIDINNAGASIKGDLLIYIPSFGSTITLRAARYASQPNLDSKAFDEINPTDSTFNTSDLVVDKFIYDAEKQDVNQIIEAFVGKYTVFKFGVGTYYSTSNFANIRRGLDITVKGAGMANTIIKGWNFDSNTDAAIGSGGTDIRSTHLCDLTVQNLYYNTYSDYSDAIQNNISFTRIRFIASIKAGNYLIYPNYFASLVIDNCQIINARTDANLYSAVYIPGNNKQNSSAFIKNTKIFGQNGYSFTRPIDIRATSNILIENCEISGPSVVGIFFGSSKKSVISNAVIRGNRIRNISEEAISFDSFGNNVALQPSIAELSISSCVTDSSKGTNKYLKLYCKARCITGSHPNEQYEEYDLASNADYLRGFNVLFSQKAGNIFAGEFAPILDVGIDETGQYVLIDSGLSASDFVLDTNNNDIDSTNSNYRQASIVSGFVSCIVENNIVENAATGLTLFYACFLCHVKNNYFKNCNSVNFSTGGELLAKPTYLLSVLNDISNNIFDEVKNVGFTSYGTAFGYNNLFCNNILKDSALSVTKEKNLAIANNSFIRTTVTFDDESTTQQSGDANPESGVAGDIFYNTSLNKLQYFDGINWQTLQ